MNKRYETVFILTPVLSEEQMKETVKKYASTIEELGGKVVFDQNWGLKKLAYPIQKKTTGFYQIFEFEGPADLTAKLELIYRRDEKVLRYLVVTLDKHGIAYNENKRTVGKEQVTVN